MVQNLSEKRFILDGFAYEPGKKYPSGSGEASQFCTCHALQHVKMNRSQR